MSAGARVALCISGLPRAVAESYPYFKEFLLDRYHPDVFIHTWLKSPQLGSWEFDNSKQYRETHLKLIMDMFNPVTIQVSQQHVEKPFYDVLSQFHNGRFLGPPLRCMTNMYSMFESIYRANELKRQHEKECGFVYDFVIRSRFDIVLAEPTAFETLDMSALYVRSFEINDWFAVSSSRNMDIYSDCYNHLTDIIVSLTQQGIEFYPESLLAVYLKQAGITFRTCPLLFSPKFEDPLPNERSI